MLSVLKYFFSILLFVLGFTAENLKAEVSFQEKRELIASYACDFLSESPEREWLGLLYLQEESSQKQLLFFSSHQKRSPQNVLEEKYPKFQEQKINLITKSFTTQEKLESSSSNSKNREWIVRAENIFFDRSVNDLVDVGDDWKTLIGKNITTIDEAPNGYKFFNYKGQKHIKRINAQNEAYPRLTIDADNNIIKYTGPNRLSNPYLAKKNLETVLGRNIPDNHQIHHLASDNVVKNHPLYKEGSKRVGAVYNVDQASNLRALSTTEAKKVTGISDKYPTHSGSHPNWDKTVTTQADIYSSRLIEKYGGLNNVPDDVLKNTYNAIEIKLEESLKAISGKVD